MKSKFLLYTTAILLLSSCNENEVFTKEQYKHVFSFVSNSDHISEKTFNLSDTTRMGYIALSMGGSTNIDKDANIHIIKSPETLESYNTTQFDNNVDKYVRILPESHYSVATMNVCIKAGQTTGVLPITIKPEGLSPDSTYYLPLRIQSFDNYEANPHRNYVFYHVRIKNKWAAAGGSTYNMLTMSYLNNNPTGIARPGTKTLFAIGANTIRMMAGNESFDASRANLDKFALYLDINPDGSIKIRPYRDINVIQLSDDKDFPNKYFIEETSHGTKYANFLLHYKYKSGSDWLEIKEELRMKITNDK